MLNIHLEKFMQSFIQSLQLLWVLVTTLSPGLKVYEHFIDIIFNNIFHEGSIMIANFLRDFMDFLFKKDLFSNYRIPIEITLFTLVFFSIFLILLHLVIYFLDLSMLFHFIFGFYILATETNKAIAIPFFLCPVIYFFFKKSFKHLESKEKID